jgi:DNA-binding NarL/FixJ family response regulator
MVICLIIENSKKVIEKIKSLKKESTDMSFTCISENQKAALNAILKSNFNRIFYNRDATKINGSNFLFEIKSSYKSTLKFMAASSKKENACKAYKKNKGRFFFIL